MAWAWLVVAGVNWPRKLHSAPSHMQQLSATTPKQLSVCVLCARKVYHYVVLSGSCFPTVRFSGLSCQQGIAANKNEPHTLLLLLLIHYKLFRKRLRHPGARYLHLG